MENSNSGKFLFGRNWCALLALGLLAIGGCTTKNTSYAPDRNFYFEVLTTGQDTLTQNLALYIKEQIPKRKYTITNHSGTEWPFYKPLQLDEEIPSDSLMPPHWFVHKMMPLKRGKKLVPDEFLVRINVFPQPDTLPNYSVDIFRMDSTGLSLSGQSNIHFIDSTEFSSAKSLYEVYLKSVIRYSFK